MGKWIEKWKQRRNNSFIHSVQTFEIKSQLVRQTYVHVRATSKSIAFILE